MGNFFFILGKNPLLSFWEISKVFSLSGQKTQFGHQFFLDKLPEKEATQTMIDQLGGTIKLGQVIDQIEKNQLQKFIEQKIVPEYLAIKQRPVFGFSYYGPDDKLRRQLKKIGLTIKSQLKEKGISSRLVVSREKQLSSVVVSKNKLINKGAEIILLENDGKVYVGITKAVQDFAGYSQRDYGRPNRDSQSGMLPPKLAKIMVNLADLDRESLLLDPFCGSGTVLQEAILLGQQRVAGSDVSHKAIKDTKKNLDWLLKKTGKKAGIKVIQADSRQIFSRIKNPQGIVSEPYLGPSRFSFEQLPKIIAQVENLYLDFFQAVKVLKKNTPIVMVWPVWQLPQKKIHLSLLPAVRQLGFQPETFYFKGKAYQSALYDRPGQKVKRQIFIFRRQ